jgi:diguanylate cyclase (GGDEF)-like protein
MSRRFTIAGRINLLLIVVAVSAAIGISAYLLYREYQAQRASVVAEVVALSKQGAQQQLAIYFRDTEVLEQLLDELLALPGVDYAALHAAEGTILVERFSPGQGSYALTDLSYLRAGYGQLEQALKAPEGDSGTGYYDLSLPIFTRVSSLEQDIDRRDYGEVLAYARNIGSQHLAAYYHVGISQRWLLYSVLPYAEKVALIVVAALLLVLFLSTFITRRITAPLASLAQMAEDISAGKLDKTIRAKGSGEVRQIASMLNIVMSELNKHRSKMDTDHHLLSMKVDERTEQLSKRNEELNQAVKQVTQTKNRLRQMAYYDGLTSLPNRQLFTEQLELMLRMAKREKQTIALLFLDLDNFKRINDSLGHSAGDILLKEVAARLTSCVRDSDLLAKYIDGEGNIGVSRLGGDEFTVVLNNIDSVETAGTIAERLLESLQAPMLIGDHELVITPSIGIATAPKDAETVEELLKLADAAMYHAKAGGRNAYQFYNSSMKSSGVGRLKLETDLRRAVERNEFVLYYQPQVDTSTGEIVGAEALVRWEHPEHGLIPPIRFIPVAEETGLIVDLGAWTMIEAARQSKAFQEEGLKLPKVAVNVSSLQFNPAFINLVQTVLEDSGLEPQYLELELTEGVIMSNAKASIDALHELKKLGVSISVDDFGTGYSSLSYLSKFPLDELKIDRSFVIDFDKSERSASLVSAIIAMGKSLHLSLVAEGVDTVEQFHFLHDRKVDIIQGYLFSEPIPGPELGLLLRNNYFPTKIRRMLKAREETNG